MVSDEDFNLKLAEIFDKKNSLSLYALLLFDTTFERFCEHEKRRIRIMTHVADVCGYEANARKFVKMIRYEDFKKRPGISEIAALGLRLYLLYICGVDWCAK